jgi:DNA-binding beta-propeller fold protein YncE
MLDRPQGIFVDTRLNLYVADCNNDRIQLFQSGQLNGTTLAGNGATGTTTLSCPNGVVIDADGYLFIVDRNYNRIVGSGSNGFRCIVGCTGVIGSASNQLSAPFALNFDSYGNIFVLDAFNNRVQKFLLMANTCGEFCMQETKEFFNTLFANVMFIYAM